MKKKVSKETVDIFLNKMSMLSFYKEVAKEFSLEVTEDCIFDCRKITVAGNIISRWFERFKEERGKWSGGELSSYLCIWGPKGNEDFGEDEVEVLDGFVCTEKSR